MLVLFSLLSLFENINKYNIFKMNRNDAFSLFPKDVIQENLNDLLNDGINRTTFVKLFGRVPLLYFVYNRFIDLLTNQYYVFHNSLFLKISPYLNANQDLYSTSPEVLQWFLDNKNQFIEIKQIISDVGPHLCKSLNLDYDVLYRLYNYVFINEENDGVVIENILNILDIPTDFLPQISKVLSFFDDDKPIIEVFNGLGVRKEYLNYIQKVRLLKIPNNDDEKFFSFIRVIDAFSSFVDLIHAIHQNFFVKIENEVVKPLVKTYIINPIDIFDVSIFERAVELNITLTLIQNYASYCTISNTTNIETLKCQMFESIQSFLSKFICNDDNDTCESNVYEKARLIVSDFTNPSINLKDLLIVKYHLPENYVNFAFGLMENLTSKNKTYLDLLQGLTLIVPANQTVSAFNYHEVPFQTFVTNVTNFVDFIVNINDSSNFKLAFDYLNRTEQWNKLYYFVSQIDQNKTLCDFNNVTGRICNYMFISIIENAKKLISNETLISIIPEKSLNVVINGLIPLLKSIELDVSQFVSNYYNLTMINSGKLNYVNFTLFIERSGNLFDKTIKFVDDIVPDFYKKLPIIGEHYHRFVKKSHKVCKVLRNNGKTLSIFYSIFGRLGVVAQMLSNGANAYVNKSTTLITMTKAVKPTYFLNFYQTELKLSELKDLKIKNIAEAITYDPLPSTLSFNDVFPIKTISKNAHLIVKEMNENILRFETVAVGLGIKKDKLKHRLIHFIRSIISPPYKSVREIAIMEGNEPEKVDRYLNNIRGFSQKVIRGQIVDFSTNDIHSTKQNKKQLSIPVIIGIAIAAFVVVSVIVALTIYFVKKQKKEPNNDYISQQTMLDDN